MNQKIQQDTSDLRRMDPYNWTLARQKPLPGMTYSLLYKATFPPRCLSVDLNWDLLSSVWWSHPPNQANGIILGTTPVDNSNYFFYDCLYPP